MSPARPFVRPIAGLGYAGMLWLLSGLLLAGAFVVVTVLPRLRITTSSTV